MDEGFIWEVPNSGGKAFPFSTLLKMDEGFIWEAPSSDGIVSVFCPAVNRWGIYLGKFIVIMA